MLRFFVDSEQTIIDEQFFKDLKVIQRFTAQQSKNNQEGKRLVKANRLDIVKHRQFFDDFALTHYKVIAGIDSIHDPRTREDICTLVRSLTAAPSAHLRSTDRMVDRQLLAALKNGEINNATLALFHRANPNCYTEQGATALLTALGFPCIKTRYAMVKLLLDHNALPNLPSMQCLTPLHYAVDHYQGVEMVFEHEKEMLLDLIKLLMEHGARLKFTLFEQLMGDDVARISPLCNIVKPSDNNVGLIRYFMTYVYPEDVYLCSSKKMESEVVDDVVVRNTALLLLSPLHPELHANMKDSTNYFKLLDLLDPSKCEENFREGIAENVKRLMGASQ